MIEQANKIKKIKIRRFSKQRLLILFVLIFLSCLTLISLFQMEKPDYGIQKAFLQFTEYSKDLFFYPKLSQKYSYAEIFFSLLVSLSLALLTTVFGVVLAFFLGIAASENLSNKYLVKIIRTAMSLIRSVPTIIWVLIFSVVANIGAEAAVLGMSFHSTAYLVKGFSESFDGIDKKTIEALKACGASYIEIISQAVLPASINNLISWSFFRFEINFGNAVAVGAAAGAGGIGYELFMAGSLNFNMSEVGFISYLIFGTAIILEISSTRIRNRIRH